MSGKFDLKKTSNGQFMFNLKAANGQVILTSERYDSKQAAKKGITSVRTNSGNEARFERRTARDNSPYFVLKARNNEIIGRSEMYAAKPGLENGIKSVAKNAPDAAVNDVT